MYKTWLLLLTFLIFQLPATAQEYTMGVVTDFEKSNQLDSIVQIMVKQIGLTLGAGKEVKLLKDNVAANNVTTEEAVKNYRRISKAVDFVGMIGGNSVQAVAKEKVLLKPTFGIGLFDPVIQGIPYVNGRSNVPNFTYLSYTNRLESDLLQLKKIVPFKHLTLLVNAGSESAINTNNPQSGLSKLKEKLEIEIDVFDIGTNVDAIMKSINPDSDAVYVADFGFLTAAEIGLLSNRLVDRKLPSFSTKVKDVNAGILASQGDEQSFAILLRKLGVMVDDALSGKPLQGMDVSINYAESLSINENTAEALQIKLPFELLFTSKAVQKSSSTSVYSLDDVLELAFKNNLNVVLSNQDIELAIQNTKTAKLAVLPNLDLFLTGRQINVENANAAIAQPEQLVTGQLQLDQLIFSQKAISGIKIAKYYEKAQEYLTQAQIQEVIVSVFNDYLNVLSAKATLEIEKENLEDLEINLINAKLQVNTGALGTAELYRWESEVAKAKQQVVVAATTLSEYKIVLNNQLAYVLDEGYDISDISIDDEVYKKMRSGFFSKLVNNMHDLKLVTGFLVQESIESNPNKKYILEQMNALEQQRILNKRLFYLPEISLQAQTTEILARGGAGSEIIPGNTLNNNNTTWNVGIGLKYPIFSQYSRRTELNTTKIELDRLNNSITQLNNDLELAVRSSMLKAIAATTNIDFSRVASENAGSNFKLMQLRYNGGDVDITQLIDAQRTHLQAKLRYAVSVFDYMRSQINIEFAVGFFSFIAPENEVDAFRNRFLQYSKTMTNEK